MEKTEQQRFEDEVRAVARRIGARYEDLMDVIKYESGAQPNKPGPLVKRGAHKGQRGLGLIQFMPATARALGTSQAELAKMDRISQLAYVEKYFNDIKRRHRLDGFNLKQLYASVLAGNPHAPETASDGRVRIKDVVKRIESKRPPLTQSPVESALGDWYGKSVIGRTEKTKPAEVVPGAGPLSESGIARRKPPAILRPAEPLQPLKRYNMSPEDTGTVGVRAEESGEDFDAVMEAAKRAAWEIMHPGEPMPDDFRSGVKDTLGKLRERREQVERELEEARKDGPAIKELEKKAGGWVEKFRNAR